VAGHWCQDRERLANPEAERLPGRIWQAYLRNGDSDPGLAADLQRAAHTAAQPARWHNALGCVLAARCGRDRAPAAQAALAEFQKAWAADATHVMAGLNLAEALFHLGQRLEAAEQARQVLAALPDGRSLPAFVLEAAHFPAEPTVFAAEWERAALDNAGNEAHEAQAKRRLIQWRAHLLLADLTQDLEHYQAAAALRGDLPLSLAALGCALARQGRFAEAADFLKRAVAGDPYDLAAARALHGCLKEIGDGRGLQELQHQRRLLARAAPQRVPVEAWFQEAARPARKPMAVAWEGPKKIVHSLAMVNRAFCQGLLERGHDVRILPAEKAEGERALAPADIHVRHGWPPDFTPPPQGHWVMMQPWEYGSLPAAWVKPMSEGVDEVWAYSRYVQDVYVQSGVPADRVHVVPLGVDVATFCPGWPPFGLATTKKFKFLFVGGTIFRKGIDVLLDAYVAAFRRGDDVCLVIKDLGVGTFYSGQTAEARIAQLQAQADAPEIEYVSRTLTPAELASLYCSCACLAHPYRGEGFGLPIAEAMACGLPAIVTGMGAALDFCRDDNAFLIPAERRYFSRKQVGDTETVDWPWLAEPDGQALRDLLRHAVAHPEEVRQKGEAACQHIRRHFTWEQAAAVAEQRLLALRHQPIRRHTAPARATEAPSARPAGRANTVSLCMIVKNAEAHLGKCLASVKDHVDEMIVVDTGSTDGTRTVAQAQGARVFDFTWVDSFAAARNESLRHAAGQWILWLDADEYLDEQNRERLRGLLTSLPADNIAFLMCQYSQLEHGPHAAAKVDHPRLFRNHPELRWSHRVHEQILPSLRQRGARVARTDLVITHDGFSDPGAQQPKIERNRRLLELELRESPTDGFVLYNLGAVALTEGRLAEALDFLHRSLHHSHPGDTLLPKLHALIVRVHHQGGDEAQALAACRAARTTFPEEAELLFWEGVLCRETGDPAGAEACWLQVLQARPAEHFAATDAGLKGYRTRHLLALLYREQGKTAEAEKLWRAAVAECPGFADAWRQLAEITG